jgi:hypothetical protein
MPSIFTPVEHGVLRVNNGMGVPTRAVIAVEDYTLELPITGFTLDLGTNHQFLHTLDEFIYVYAFGDRIGELMLSGVAFTGCIQDHSSGGDLAGTLGAAALLTHYLKNRIGRRAGPGSSLILIDAVAGISSSVLTGFLTGMRMDVPNPALPIVQWALRYNVIINERVAPGGADGTGGGPTAVG